MSFRGFSNPAKGRFKFKTSSILSNTTELAIQLTAFANADGGKILIGVNDDGTIEGMNAHKGHQEHIMNVAADKCVPPIRPTFEIIKPDVDSDVYIVEVLRGKCAHGVKESEGGLAFYVRVGSTSPFHDR